MSNSTIALPTLISPPFEAGCERRLAGVAIPRPNLSAQERVEMYELFETYFAGTATPSSRPTWPKKRPWFCCATPGTEGFEDFRP